MDHAQGIENAEHSELVAVYDVVPERARAFAEDFRVDVETDLEAFLSRTDIDAVTVATPSGARADVAVPAARAGKHLLCEKPIEVTVSRAGEIVRAARESGVLLACVFQARTTLIFSWHSGCAADARAGESETLSAGGVTSQNASEAVKGSEDYHQYENTAQNLTEAAPPQAHSCPPPRPRIRLIRGLFLPDPLCRALCSSSK